MRTPKPSFRTAPRPSLVLIAASAFLAAGGKSDVPRGLVVSPPGHASGYVHYAPTGSVYLLDNGNLLRGARYPDPEVFRGGGQGGRLQEFTWDGKLVWDFPFATEDYLLHHDIAVLPNGNVLAIAWEAKSGTCSPT